MQNVIPEAANSEASSSHLPLPTNHQHQDTLDGDASQDATVIPSSANNRVAQEEEDSEPVSSSPPAKKGRFFFRRCFESTFNPDSLPGHNIILAEDSDEGD